jgi:hypothetical protein
MKQVVYFNIPFQKPPGRIEDNHKFQSGWISSRPKFELGKLLNIKESDVAYFKIPSQDMCGQSPA